MIEKITIKDALEILKRRIFIILVSAICITALIVFTSLYLMKPVYKHSTQVIAGSLGATEEETTGNDYQENRQLVLSYMDVINSPATMRAVKKELNLKRSSYDLLEQVAVTNRDNSQIITIAVKDTNPKLTKDIAQTTAEQSIENFKSYTKVKNLNIIEDTAMTEETELLFPKPKIIIAISIIVSIFAGIGLAVIREFMDDSVHSEKELESMDLRVLGKGKLFTKKPIKSNYNSVKY